MRYTIGMTLGTLALGLTLLGAHYAASRTASAGPAYTSSIQIPDHHREERGEHDREEQREAIQRAGLAQVNLTQAIAAALAQVPGTALKAKLDNENGNLVYKQLPQNLR